MARHIDEITITRDGLIHRYANATGRTYGRAHDMVANKDLEELRDFVESIEIMKGAGRGQRKSFAQSQPTTTVQGQTR